jgi:hypothetical protein
LALVELAIELDVVMLFDQRRDDVVPVGLIDRIDLGRDLERQSGEGGDFDRAIRPLLRRDAAEECEIASFRLNGRRSRGKP